MPLRGERHHMKIQDKLIEEERERERKLVCETITQDNSQTHTITHFSHHHPLVYVEPDDYRVFSCNTCTRSGRGKRYHCGQCKFDLHKICAEAPFTWLLRHMSPQELEASGMHWSQVITTFAHPEHQVTIEYKRRYFKCGHCNDSGDGLRFRCEPCDVEFHTVCAMNPTRLTTYLHPQHELELMIRPHFKKCDLCGTDGPTNNRIYKCKQCEFYLHPECSQWPLYLAHPIHAPHPLVLKPCAQSEGRYMYSCNPCGLNFNVCRLWEQSRLGQGEDVRRYYGNQYFNILPVTNLTLPKSFRVQLQSSSDTNLLLTVVDGVALLNV